MPGLDRGLIAGFFLGCLVFLATIGYTPYPLSWAVKTLPIVCLALLAFRRFPGRAGWLMGMGFVMSGLGDVLLELPRTPLRFQAGMGAFIFAHLCYTANFLRHFSWRPDRAVFMGAVLCGAAAYGGFLFSYLGAMAVPILVYFGIILIMALSTALSRDSHWIAMAGAALFVLSDGLIALNMFVTPVPASDVWIMVTYYSAQALLNAGVWMGENGRPCRSQGHFKG